MTSITTPPPDRAFSGNEIYLEVQTDLITGTRAAFEFDLSAGGPADTETLELVWPGGGITYTAAAAPGAAATDWPLQGGGESVEDYTTRIADFLRSSQVVGALFDVVLTDAASGLITLQAKALEVFDLDFTNGFSGVVVAATDGTAAASEPNLSALAQVWSDTGDFNTDALLNTQHSPYRTDTAGTWFDLSAAFAGLRPHLPNRLTINPTVFIALIHEEVTTNWTRYYLRTADKYGVPPVADALVRSEESYVAILGAASADSLHDVDAPLRHAYRRRDKEKFYKPASDFQPDWMYWVCPDEVTGVYGTVLITWSDGTQSTYNPFGTTLITVVPGQMYYFGCGYRQLKLQTRTPPGGTDPTAYIAAWQFAVTTGSLMLGVHSVDYLLTCSPWERYLLISNGVGGCESVLVHGKTQQGSTSEVEEYNSPRYPGKASTEGDFSVFAASSRDTYTFNTGWYSDPYYLEHLRQLPLADTWLIDTDQKRFLKLIIETKEIITRSDDETLFALEFKAKAGWMNAAANV